MHPPSPSRAAWFVGAALVGLGLVACDSDRLARPTPTASLGADRIGDEQDRGGDPALRPLDHIVVIYLENHSFDNLYGEFPGANGLANSGATSTQVDGLGNPFATLPMTASSPFPHTLSNAPFNIEQYVPANMKIPDLVHRYYQEQQQIDGGKMDKFALVSDAKGEVMGFYHTAALPLADVVSQYTLCDNFFHAAFGGSFLNHQYLIAATPPRYHDPANSIAKFQIAETVSGRPDVPGKNQSAPVRPATWAW